MKIYYKTNVSKNVSLIFFKGTSKYSPFDVNLIKTTKGMEMRNTFSLTFACVLMFKQVRRQFSASLIHNCRNVVLLKFLEAVDINYQRFGKFQTKRIP